MIQVWRVHPIEIIGEATSTISDSFRIAYPHIPWRDIIPMRNVLVHHYFGIDLREIWNTVHLDLPVMKSQAQGAIVSM